VKKLLPLFFSTVALLTAAHGASIVVEADDDNGFSFANGTDLAQGNLVRVGYFDVTDSVIAASSTTLVGLQFLDSHFFEFGRLHIGDTYNIPGHFAGTANLNTAGGSAFDNQQISLWVFATAANNDPLANFSNVTQTGVFYADRTQVLSWRIRPHAEIPNTSTIDISDLTNGAGNALVPAAHVVVGSFPTGTSDATGGANFGLAPVPEPTAVALLALGVATLGLRRRRS
jgi:hypothetical protein